MTIEQQRIKIAEVCGWTEQKVQSIADLMGVEPASNEMKFQTGIHPTLKVFQVVPNYPEDLNAMHSAVMSLGPAKLAYFEQLMNERFGFLKCMHATASERAELFLKACDLWTE